jgi:hypothetical protein
MFEARRYDRTKNVKIDRFDAIIVRVPAQNLIRINVVTRQRGSLIYWIPLGGNTLEILWILFRHWE